MAVVPFTGPREAPKQDVDPSFLQMAGAIIYQQKQTSETEKPKPNEPDPSL